MRVKRQRVPGLLLGMVDGGVSLLERRVLRLLEGRVVWGRWARVVGAGVCVAVMGAASLGVGMLAVRASVAQQITELPVLNVADSTLKFDVASVRQNKSEDDPTASIALGPGDVFTPTGGSFAFTNYPLINYIAFAYKMNPRQLAGMQHKLPDWVATDRFDIQAKTEKRDATKDEVRMMMRNLLAERFKLVMRKETQQVPVFALVLAKPGKTGPQLKPHPADAPCSNDPHSESAAASPQDIPSACGGNFMMPTDTPGLRKMAGRNVAFGTLVIGLGNWGNPGRPLLDQTGLSGKFDFTMEYAPEPGADAPGAASAPVGPSFLEALTEQLGLKLVPTKGPAVSLVIDHIERPTEN